MKLEAGYIFVYAFVDADLYNYFFSSENKWFWYLRHSKLPTNCSELVTEQINNMSCN